MDKVLISGVALRENSTVIMMKYYSTCQSLAARLRVWWVHVPAVLASSQYCFYSSCVYSMSYSQCRSTLAFLSNS